MKSRANVKAHPIHPALIPFPFAFLVGAFLFDLAGVVLARPAWFVTGGHLTLAGLVAGIVAAIPGAIDYLHSVPPRSSGRRRATKHALGNVLALALFTMSFLTRESGSPTTITLLLEGAGTLALGYAGWLGGTLVTRNLIGVDHRYADAGKWQENDVAAAAGDTVVVGRVDDLKDDQMKLLRVNGRRIVLGRRHGEYVAFDDRCTHRGGPLADGVLIGGTVQCLWHGSQFDAGTGAVRCGPAREPVRAYPLRVENGQILLVLPRG